jgi:hypothetical protein
MSISFEELILTTPTNVFYFFLFMLSSTKDYIEPTTGLKII